MGGSAHEARGVGVDRFLAYYDNPGAFAFDNFTDPLSPSGRLELTGYQVDVLRRVLAGRDVTWRASHGVGKTTTMAVAVFLFLTLNPDSKVVTTAPTWYQVSTVMWKEIGKWHTRFRFKAYWDLSSVKLQSTARPSTWFAVGRAAARPENMEGFHSPKLLFIVDEAKGVSDSIFDAVDGALSTEGGQRVYVSTPGSRTGKFYESHHGRIANLFDVVHTDGETAERVSRRWIETKKLEWGDESPIYIAKVRGEFPQEGDDVLYRLSWVDAANDAFEETTDGRAITEGGTPAVVHASHYAIGCDVARFGLNETVAIGGSLSRVDMLSRWARAATTDTTAKLIGLRNEVEASGRHVDLIAVDDSGLGGGVTDQLRQASIPVEGVLFGGATADKEHFANLKAEMAWQLRNALDANWRARADRKPGTFALLASDKLKGQLCAMRYRYLQRGVMAIVDPDDPTIPASEIARGLKVSPDHAHALILQHRGAALASSVGVGVVERPERQGREVEMAQRSSRAGRMFARRW